MPSKRVTQKQKQRQSVVIHIGDKVAKKKQRKPRRNPQKKQQLPPVEPVIVPFSRVPPIWIQQPEPMRPFASNEPPLPVNIAKEAVKAPTTIEVPKQMTPEPPMRMKDIYRESPEFREKNPMGEPTREASPPPITKTPLITDSPIPIGATIMRNSPWSEKSWKEGLQTGYKKAPPADEPVFAKAAAPSVESPVSLAQIVETTVKKKKPTAAEARAIPEAERTPEHLKILEKGAKISASRKEREAAAKAANAAANAPGSLGVGPIMATPERGLLAEPVKEYAFARTT